MAGEVAQGLAIAIIVILIIIIFVELWKSDKMISDDGFGKWGPEIRGDCEASSNLCSQGGTQEIIRECIPNRETGRGCLNSKGEQTFDSIIKTVPCKPKCRKYIWSDVSDDICNPLPEESNSDIGIKTRTLKCVRNDPDGSNDCTTTEASKYVGVGGIVGLYPQFQVYQQGQTFSFDVPCSIWGCNSGYDQDKCEFNKAMNYSDVCDVGGDVGGDNGGDVGDSNGEFNTLKEGFILFNGPNDKTLADKIRTGSLPDEFSGCISACRLFPGKSSIGYEEFDPLLNSVLLFRIPNVGYLTTVHVPSKGKNNIKFRDTKDRPSDKLKDVQFQLVKFEKIAESGRTESSTASYLPEPVVRRTTYSGNANVDSSDREGRVGCTPEEIEFSTASLFLLGPRSYQPNALQAQLMSSIAGSYHGWVASDDKNNISWRQALIHYKGPGISTNEAELFQIKPLSRFQHSKLPGFSTKMKGIMMINLTKNGNSIYVKDSTSNKSVSLDKVEVLVFDHSVNIKRRSDRSNGNCNLHFTP